MTDTIMARLLREVRQTHRTCDHKFVDSTTCLKCGWSPASALTGGTPDPTIERILMDTETSMNGLREDVDRLTIQIERLLQERRHIIDVLTTFYRSDISISALTPVLDLCVELNSTLQPERMK